MNDDLSLLDATAQAALVRTGEVTAAELVEHGREADGLLGGEGMTVAEARPHSGRVRPTITPLLP